MQIYSFNQQHVEINSVYFHKNTKQQRLESYPKRMVYEGREYSFLDGGWRYLVKTGEKLVKLFDVSDGQSQYRLRLDEGNNWTLINIKNQPTNELAIV